MTTTSLIDVSGGQRGQAAIEALVCLLALGVLWAGVAWLGRVQDLALQASHASRYAAFSATRSDQGPSPKGIRQGTFDGQANQWSDRHGRALQHSVYQDLRINVHRSDKFLPDVHAGATDPRVVQLRDELLNIDQRIVSAQVDLVPSNEISPFGGEGTLLKLGQLDRAYPHIRRQTSILTGSGHSSGDRSAADRIASSSLAWASIADRSYRLGRRVSSVASRVDSGWSRPVPDFDWLHPWAEYVPPHHLRSNR